MLASHDLYLGNKSRLQYIVTVVSPTQLLPYCMQVIHALDHFVTDAGASSYAEVRSLEIATITRDADSVNNWAPPTTGILVTAVCQRQLNGCGRPGGELRALEVHPKAGIALVLQGTGGVGIW